MISSRRLYNLVEDSAERLKDWLHPKAFPGRGDAPLPPVFVIALPKSGSIYLQRALRRTLRVEIQHIGGAGMSGSCFRFDNITRFERGNVLSREHLQPTAFQLAMLGQYGVNRVVLHLRDPRDAIVSWTRHMDDILTRRGLRSVSLSCEAVLPEAYVGWDFQGRLRWQVEHVLPMFITWTQRWLELADGSRDVKFLITEYRELARDNRALLTKILDFYEIPYQDDWISMPRVEVGRNNIRRLPGGGNEMTREVFEQATALMAPELCTRFGWPKEPSQQLAS